MTLSEFDQQRSTRPCGSCGASGLATELNTNNNGLLVCCPHCGSKRPWGTLLYLKQNEHKRPKRPPLPEGATLDSIWEQYDNRCVMCGASKSALATLGIGRQVHHVIPYAAEGHKGPLIPLCTPCHPVVTERQRIYWFYQRVVLKSQNPVDHDDKQDSKETEPAVTRGVGYLRSAAQDLSMRPANPPLEPTAGKRGGSAASRYVSGKSRELADEGHRAAVVRL